VTPDCGAYCRVTSCFHARGPMLAATPATVSATASRSRGLNTTRICRMCRLAPNVHGHNIRPVNKIRFPSAAGYTLRVCHIMHHFKLWRGVLSGKQLCWRPLRQTTVLASSQANDCAGAEKMDRHCECQKHSATRWQPISFYKVI